MIKFFVNFFILFLLFQNIIFNVIPLPSFFGYWDEIIEIIILCIGFIFLAVNHKMTFKKENLITIGIFLSIVLVGLLGNFFFKYASSVNAIIRDILVFLKFPLIYFLLKINNIDEKIVSKLSKTTIKIVKFIIFVMFVCGIASLFFDLGMSQNEIRFGLRPFMFLFSHPTYLVLNSILLLAFINTVSPNSKIYEIMLIIIVILSMRTKGIAAIAVYIFIKYFANKMKKVKIIYWVSILAVVLIFSYSKLALYNSYSSSPREQLYMGAIELMKMCFPIGSGFATYASHLSGVSNSFVYYVINITYYIPSTKYGLTALGDAGFANYLGQYGVLGCGLIILLAKKLYEITFKDVDNKEPVLLIIIYILIALTSESLLLNCGIELAFNLSIISCLNKKEKVAK